MTQEQVEKRRAYYRQYYKDNKEIFTKCSSRYYWENKAMILSKMKKKYEEKKSLNQRAERQAEAV